MKSYLKLVNFEVNRFFKFYILLIGILIVSQIVGVIIQASYYMSRAESWMTSQNLSANDYVKYYDHYYFRNFIVSEWFILPIVGCIVVLVLYVFFIWYRDWFGKSKFMYRLLMLPTERLNIYFAKLTAIMLFVLGLIGLQIPLVAVEQKISNAIVAAGFRSEIPLFELFRIDILQILYPTTLVDFIVIYGLGLLIVAVSFTAILLERSYHLKGIFLAVLYGALAIVVITAPSIINSFVGNYFYKVEIFMMSLVGSVLILGSAIWLANYLLKYKIKV